MAARARPGPMSITGQSRACRASPRGGFWRGSVAKSRGGPRWGSALGPLLRLGLLLHVGTQHCVDAALIAFALLLEEVEHIFINTNGDRLFPGRDHQNGVRPVDIDGCCVRIVCDSLGNVLVGQRVDARPVSLALPAITPLSRYDILFFHVS